jgi:hypothetical protein
MQDAKGKTSQGIRGGGGQDRSMTTIENRQVIEIA